MHSPYTLKITYGQRLGTCGGLEAIVSNDTEAKALRIIITISGNDSKTYNELRAYVEFSDGDNTIEDINVILKDQKFCSLIEYYQKKVIYASSREQLLLNDSTIAHEAEGNTQQRTNLLADLTRSIFSRSESKINRTVTADLLLLLKYILQKSSVYTSCRIYNQEEITIARTYMGYRNLTMFDRKFASGLFYLHLANVILANQLILKPATDFITQVANAMSLLRRRALTYSIIIMAVNYLLNYLLIGGPSNPILFILPLIWPIAALCLRRYGPKIFSIIVRYAISRILKSQNKKNNLIENFLGIKLDIA